MSFSLVKKTGLYATSLAVACVVVTGAGLSNSGRAAAAANSVKRIDILAAGVDYTTVGTSRQVEHAKLLHSRGFKQ